MYYIKRLIYDLFFKGSKTKKMILLILLILFFVLKPVFISAEVAENEGDTQQEPLPEQSDVSETQEIMQQILDELSNLRFDMQEEKRLQLEAAEREEEANAEAEALALEEIELYSLSQSQNNITYGFLENFRYYYTGSENTDSRASQYIYVFTENTKFRKEGNTLYYENGSCYFIHVPYSGNYAISDVGSDSINLSQGWLSIYSNIPGVDRPAVYQISKDSEKAFERFEDFSMLFFALLVGWKITRLIFSGANSDRSI